jgi:hypothetical protein
VFSSFSEEKMSQDKKVAAETKLTEEEKLFEEKKTVDSYIAGFVESMAKTNTEKITVGAKAKTPPFARRLSLQSLV